MFDAFGHYAPFIQDYIYEHGWQKLRAIQLAGADVIFNTDNNLLLSAATASGKTEAAFFPILTELAQDPPDSVGCLYIAPLKALINDQYLRLSDLCAGGDIPVWRYHGDVSQSQKRKLFKHPSGVLQITPESLESLMINKHADIPRLFGDLRYIVIDELHSFLRSDRGGQTFCLIERLGRLAACDPRRVGLSATIGDPRAAGRFLAAGSRRKTSIPKIKDDHQVWRLSMEHFYKTDPQAGAGSAAGQPPLAKASDQAPEMADPSMAYIFDHTRGKKCLVFTNSREECEAVCQVLRQYCEAKHEPDRFMIHHGNLSAAFRQSAEEAMKDDNVKLTTCATATLELGIDIGQLERAFQIDAPFTVSGFLQRMGRTGRRGNPPEMWFVMREDHPESRAMLPVLFPWPLLQGIALVQLYLEERWVEPPRENRLPYSLLYHQTMSTLASMGEMTPAELASRVLSLSYFHRVSQADYKVLLRHLLKTDQIQWTENKGLIVGLSGERVTNNFKFYAVFQENEEYSVHSASEELGTIVKPPPIGDKVAIAGHVWVVEEIDRQRHQVYVHRVKGRIPAYFGDVPGDIHPRILERMRQILSEDRNYPYLMANAVARLNETRSMASMAGMPAKQLVNLGGKTWCLFPWTGTYAFLALERLLKLKCAKRLGLKNFDSVRPYYMQFSMDVSPEDFFAIVKEEASKDFDPLDLVYPKEVPVFDKYDEYLPDELVRKEFAESVLDLAEMRRCVEKMR
ncbi:DEAD/DEAH box helicase [Lactobacillus porci]|uniref:DEAD/DEAH box helicase n=1 Tax=Lactobacillus porci TaxID=2012477 RepID=A0A6A8MC19_9LACO|nr:DEAD/DEAH box helicase [Lactobacillus porci]MDD6415988.1 DEAD/DEAH box helicase [Lactobacillus porci]MST86431.1 DEAD/DEAH box helicase [Lactobacillus porci]